MFISQVQVTRPKNQVPHLCGRVQGLNPNLSSSHHLYASRGRHTDAGHQSQLLSFGLQHGMTESQIDPSSLG